MSFPIPSLTIAEVRSLESQGPAICAFNSYRMIPKDASGTFEISLQLFDTVTAIPELISFVVIRFKPCLPQSHSLRLEKGVTRVIPILVILEPVNVGHGDGSCRLCFTKSAPIWQSRYFRG